MLPLKIEGANCVMSGPEGSGIRDLHVLVDGNICFSRWEPTPEELGILMQGGSMELAVIDGQPAVSLIAVEHA